MSELSAIGAPTRPAWVALGIAYGLLFTAFAWGVRASAGRNRPLRVAGNLLLAYGFLSLAWPLAPMHQRGAVPTLTDTLHIGLAIVTVLLMLFAITLGAAAFGKRFRRYSIATLLLLVAFGVLTFLDAPRIAENLPTPLMGIWERMDIGVFLLWVVVLALALLRPSSRRDSTVASAPSTTRVAGTVAPGFEEVRAEFERNFAERGEIGAAVAAYWRGEKVVDLWGGGRIPGADAPWNRDTMVVVMSTTKGLAAMTLAVANARGWLDYDAPVARYWPEFGQNGKGTITVRQMLGHEAGLVLLDAKLTVGMLRDLDHVARVLARQAPAWTPGTRHGYHTMTLGLYMQELMRRVDPAHRSLGRFFHEEIATPLHLDLYIGLPPEIPDERLATLKPLSMWRALRAVRSAPSALIKQLLRPHSLLRRSMILDLSWQDRSELEVELPSGNGVGTARAIARAYSAFAEGGAELGLTPETLARLAAAPVIARPQDEVLGVPTYFSLGFMRPGPDVRFGSSPRAFGAPGAGGSFAFADPDARLGYAYVMNKMDFWLMDDPREKALRDAIYRAMVRRDGESGSGEQAHLATRVPEEHGLVVVEPSGAHV